jgi:uncharacterized RDD family membrane protein YckC
LFSRRGVVIALLFWMLADSTEFLNQPDLRPGAFWTYWTLLFLGSRRLHHRADSHERPDAGQQVAGVIVLQPTAASSRCAPRLFVGPFARVLVRVRFGLFVAVVDKNRETWHDKAARTAAFRFEESA